MYFNQLNIDTAPYAIEVRGVNGQVYFTDVVAKNLSLAGVYSCDPQFVLDKVSGDSGWDTIKCGTV